MCVCDFVCIHMVLILMNFDTGLSQVLGSR